MSPLGLVHVAAGFVAVVLAIVVLSRRKGDQRHRRLGWTYVAFMGTALVSILAAGATNPRPFHAYALVVALALAAAVAATRLRNRFANWRGWHAALMSFSLLGACVAVGGVIGGLLLGVGRGPVYYRMFNIVIAALTAIGLTWINAHPTVWGSAEAKQRNRRARLQYSGAVITASAALILAQWMAFIR